MAESAKKKNPGLWKRIVARIKAGTKGGRAGQWSARKAQIVAREYEEAGGGYKGGKGEKQKSLEKWGKERWSTREEYEKRVKAAKVAKKAKQRSAKGDSRS